MLQSITSRIPASLVTALHEAVFLGSTYACLALLAAWAGSVLGLHSDPAGRLSR